MNTYEKMGLVIFIILNTAISDLVGGANVFFIYTLGASIFATLFVFGHKFSK